MLQPHFLKAESMGRAAHRAKATGPSLLAPLANALEGGGAPPGPQEDGEPSGAPKAQTAAREAGRASDLVKGRKSYRNPRGSEYGIRGAGHNPGPCEESPQSLLPGSARSRAQPCLWLRARSTRT